MTPDITRKKVELRFSENEGIHVLEAFALVWFPFVPKSTFSIRTQKFFFFYVFEIMTCALNVAFYIYI